MSIGLALVAIGIVWIVWIVWNIGKGGEKVEISPDEARRGIQQGKYDVIVDVRTPEEWARGHRSDAVSVPIGEFVTAFPKRVPSKDARVLFVCRKGIRAPAAALMAQKKGYTRVQAVAGDHDGLVE
jgi:rhodanese-related sulfurtransferase